MAVTNPSMIWRHVASWLLTIVTLASLASIGWFGHLTHWTFGLAGDHSAVGHEASDSPDHGLSDTPGRSDQKPAGSDTAGSVAAGSDAAGSVDQAAGSAITFNAASDVERAGIETVPVQTQPITERIAANGVVRYDERRIAQLSVRAPGSVWRVEKRLGDSVSKGDVLVIIDSAEVGRLKAELLTALVVHESRREALSILEEIRGVVMGRQLREARSAMRESRNSLLNAEQALVNLGFEISLEELAALDDDARAEHMRLLGLPPAMLAGIDVELVSSNLLPLRAPFDGVVIGRDVVVGEIADPSRSIFEIVDLSAMWIVLNVAKEDAARLAIGQRVTFCPDGDDREHASEISWISTEVDEKTRTLQVRAEVKTGQPASSSLQLSGLRANAFGRGAIEVDVRHQARVVPIESVQSLGSDWVVFVPTGATTFEARTIAKGLECDGIVELRGDLAGITHVVGPGSHVLKSQLLLDGVESGDL
jgi:cobalt-zinc-cadmium efflux system membrane fusion protein